MSEIKRRSHRTYSGKKCVLKNFANFTGKYLCWSLVLKDTPTLLKRFQPRCFPLKLAKFLRIPILKNICERLILSKRRNFYWTYLTWFAKHVKPSNRHTPLITFFDWDAVFSLIGTPDVYYIWKLLDAALIRGRR